MPARRTTNQYSSVQRLYWAQVMVCLGMVAGILLSWPLWTTERFYPLLPIIPRALVLWSAYDVLLTALLLLANMASLISERYRRVCLLTALIFAVLLLLGDQSRLQPWFVMYCAMLLVILDGLKPHAATTVTAATRQEYALHSLRIIIAGTYLWAGLQKLNARYFLEIFPFISQPIVKYLPESDPLLLLLALAGPVVEICLGLAFLFGWQLRLALYICASLHVFLLLMFGPFGINFNSVIWPWNVLMPIVSLILFRRVPSFSWRDTLLGGNRCARLFVQTFFLVLPALSFSGYWDAYLSAALYSGNTRRARIIMPKDGLAELPQVVQAIAKPVELDDTTTELFTFMDSEWTYAELNVPPYPEERIIFNMFSTICGHVTNQHHIRLVLYQRPAIRSSHMPRTTYRCSDLRN